MEIAAVAVSSASTPFELLEFWAGGSAVTGMLDHRSGPRRLADAARLAAAAPLRPNRHSTASWLTAFSVFSVFPEAFSFVEDAEAAARVFVLRSVRVQDAVQNILSGLFVHFSVENDVFGFAQIFTLVFLLEKVLRRR